MSPPANPAGRSQGRIGLHSLAPAAGSRRVRKRVGRGEGSGTGKTAGRGQKGAGSRSGSKRRAPLEGGQMPIHMRMRKLRGPHMKKSMPFEPFRTRTQPVNISALEEFEYSDLRRYRDELMKLDEPTQLLLREHVLPAQERTYCTIKSIRTTPS